ncbi:MAG: group II intron reverse transcriptase/maturase [Clostridia bacterium]|nr:group II intron reverse transcriptase/maturase [Clostridia bacterium]
MQRPQKTAEAGCPCEGMLETKSNKGACSIVLTETDREDGAENLLERILDRNNLNQAYLKVKRNGGSAGVDGMTVEEMLPYLKEHREELLEALRSERYKPKAVRRVEIPKPDGGKRMLGVPTVIDRMIQQAIVQVLQPIYEPLFSESSYGFRPKRSAQQAMKQALEYYNEGYTQVVDLDLAKYFDTVNHEILIGMLREQVKDERVSRLIRKYLKSGVMINGLISPTTEGTPQGGNLSPLLSNIYLTAFDRMLESRGHKFVRYADDCNIYVKSRRAAERVMANCTKFLEGTLKLKVNRKKSQVGSPLRLKFLGFSMYKTGKKAGIRPHGKSIRKFKDKIRELTSRKQARSVELILKRLKRYTVGWLGYYSIADMESNIKRLNEWIRRRIRQIYWKQWKKIKTKHDNLVKLGIDNENAWKWANSRKAYWRIADSHILHKSLTNKYLASVGYDDILERYKVLHLNY